MAKIGYMLLAPGYDDAEADAKWMADFGCVEIIRETPAGGSSRTAWEELTSRARFGDTIVVPKLSNALGGIRQLAMFLELCRVGNLRFVSIHDKIDSADELFPETKTSQVLAAIALLPKEAAALRRKPSHVKSIMRIGEKKGRKEKRVSASAVRKGDRNRLIVEKYLAGEPVEEIFRASGFKSRSSVFRILRGADVELNRNPVAAVPQRKAVDREERNKLVVRMYQEGASLEDIHRASGFNSRSSVFRILNAAGISLDRGHTRGPRKKKGE